MTLIRRLRLLVLALLALVFAACKYDLVKETTFDYNEKKNAADYDDFILPPESVTASQGQSKSVVLSWLPVKNAVQYYIYSAPSPYDSFVKISETRGAETEIVIDEEPGITKYYCVSAVNYYGSVSAKSIVVMGTSLAVPVITDIEASEEGDAVSVEWWMDNCSDTTYEDSVEFYIYTSLKSSPNIKYKTEKTLGSSRRIRIDGLVSKTEYLFEVEVVNNQTGQKETSGKYSAETAHRVLPDPPLDFTVTQGTSTSEILLSWKTPDGAWYRENSGASGFVKHPLYFEVYKKEAGKNEDYTSIGLIAVTPNDSWSHRKTQFGNLSTYAIENSQEKLDSPYDSYYVGAQITFTDTIDEEDRGKKYSYYVQSVTDDTPDGKKITSQSSCTLETEGWTVAVPAFTVKSNYTQEGEKFTSISFTYNLRFENYGIPYAYFVKTEKLPLGEGSGTSQVEAYASVESINSHAEIFTPVVIPEQMGYYKYTLYICPVGTDQTAYESACFSKAPASGKYIVTDDAESIPKIKNFSVDDGYANKYELKWEYNSDYVYTVHWWKMNGNEKGNEEIEEVVINNENITKEVTSEGEKEFYNFTHSEIQSGDRRIYALEASTGISLTERLFTDDTKTEELIFETLGTAEPSFTTYDYNTITVTWSKVQRVDIDADGNYTVSAKYEDGGTEIVTESNTIIQSVDGDNNTFQCVITNPTGWDDATVSGKKINLTVTAKNGTKGSTTSQAIPVCTLGPALADLKVAQTVGNNKITVQWNKIEGAAGYKIIRQRFKDGAGKDPDENGLDNYYINGNTITVNGETVDSNYATIRDNGNGTFLFEDKAVDALDSTNPYSVNQACIEWGLPFSYQIVPIKEGNEENPPKYKHPQAKLGATKGYGLNVQAQKSESGTTQVITWEPPYYYNINEKPSIYYRKAGFVQNKWTKIEADFSEDKKTAYVIPESNVEAYEYMVAYKQTLSTLEEVVPNSLINDNKIGLSIMENTEQANKGYLLAVKLRARTGTGYSEIISWDEWDYEKRAIGPDSAYISIINYNLSDQGIKVVTLDSNLHYSSKETLENTTILDTNDVEFEIKPNVVMNESSIPTKGPLLVLRDARHYYYLTLERDGKTPVELYKNTDDDEKNVYCYRNINDYEFAKMVMLVFTEGMKKIGELDFDVPYEFGDGTGGFVSAEHEKRVSDKYFYSFNNYAPKLTMITGKESASVRINVPQSICYRNMTTEGSYPKSFDEITISVEGTDSKMPDTYKGSLKFQLTITKPLFQSVDSSCTIKAKNTTINLDTVESRRFFVPFRVWKDDYYYDQNNAYGWWPAGN